MREGRRPLYAHQAVNQFGHGLAAPFVPYYATRLGATTVDLGWLQAFTNLFPNLLQMPWGRLSDRVGRRVPFIVFGTITAMSLFLLIAASASPWQLILVVLVQAIATSMIVPNWSALLGERTDFGRRGRVFGTVSQIGGAMSLAGTLLAAYIVFHAPPTEAHAFQLPFVIAAIVGVASALVLFLVRETKRVVADPSPAPGAAANDHDRRADFLFFVKVQTLYNFFMSMIWPLAPITVAVILGASNFDIVVITVISVVSTIVIQSQVGRLLDRVGPAALIQASRFLFLLVPLAYGFANSLFWIYVITALMGVAVAIVNIAFNAYILDVAPPRKHAEYFGLFNGAIGVVTFAGSLIGGYLARLLSGSWSLWLALLAVYLISFAGRTVGAVLCLRIRDPANYPESVNDVWRRFQRYFAYERHGSAPSALNTPILPPSAHRRESHHPAGERAPREEGSPSVPNPVVPVEPPRARVKEDVVDRDATAVRKERL